MLILLPCPECGSPAEVTDRFALNSTDGPIAHVALRCAARHHFKMPVEMLPAQGQEQLRAQEPRHAHQVPGAVDGQAVHGPCRSSYRAGGIMDELTHQPAALVPTRLGSLRVETCGSGPPAVLWHSLFADSSTWDRVRRPLAAARRLLLIDGPAHGGSPPVPRAFTLAECAGAAADVLDRLGIDEPADWVGNAWGGHVGITFASAYPARCRSLAAIGTPTHPLTPGERRRVVLLASLYRLAGPVPPLVHTLTDALLGPHARTTDPEAAALVGDAFRRATRQGMYIAIQSVSLNRPDLTPVLGNISTPTLLATGTSDPMCTPASASAAAARMPRGASVTLPGAGHIAPLLQAAPAVVEMITDFWRDPAAMVVRHRPIAAPSTPRASAT
jgi:pimeloyl-ACP methyl ester carboxylesterase